MCTVFDSISSNIHEVLSIHRSANAIIFGNFISHNKNWLTYSGGSDQPGEFCYNFFISNDLSQMVNVPTQTPDYDSHSPALLDLFLSCVDSICSTIAFPPLRNSDYAFVSVSIDFPSKLQREAPFHGVTYDYSRAYWDGSCDHWKDVPGEDILILGASGNASAFCEWVQVGIDIYIYLKKNIRSSLIHLHGLHV